MGCGKNNKRIVEQGRLRDVRRNPRPDGADHHVDLTVMQRPRKLSLGSLDNHHVYVGLNAMKGRDRAGQDAGA